MAKRRKKEVVADVLVDEQEREREAHTEIVEQPAERETPVAEQAAEAEVGEEAKLPNSVVAPKYKDKYLEAAKANGWAGKAPKRSNWDWLSQEVAKVCLNEKGKININDFLGLLDANGVDYSKWTNKNKGWEGRLRMTGRVALQKVVANRGVLVVGGGNEVTPPEEWAAKFKDKANS